MKGVILAGGTGSRLFPLTAVTNKHLVPVGKLPMIEYPLFTLKQMGITEISVVTGGEIKNLAEYLSQMHPEINFSYYYQREAGGIAQALLMAEPSCRNQRIAVILGDNIFEDNFTGYARNFDKSKDGSKLFLKEVADPQRFGVAETTRNSRIVSIEEKPKQPKSNQAVTGLYFYNESVFDKIRTLKPSARGELEITDVNNMYIQDEQSMYSPVNGFWSDAGTVESRKRCEEFVERGLEDRVIASLSEAIKGKLPK